jgi:hypothetical protein
MQKSSQVFLPIVGAVLVFGGVPEWASIENVQLDTRTGSNTVVLTNRSLGIIWVPGYFSWKPMSGYQRQLEDGWETQFGKACANGFGWQPVFPMQRVEFSVVLPEGVSRVVVNVSSSAGLSHVVAGPDAQIGI